MNADITAKTLDLIKAAMSNPVGDLAKAWTQAGTATSGLTAYDLEGPAKTLYPVITPLRNMLPRVSGKGGIQANWRAITGVNTQAISAGMGQGNRGGVATTSTKDYTAAYKTIGLDDYVTFQADWSAQGFDDVKARAVEGLLRGVMIQEEKIILGGNASIAVGVTPTPTVTPSNTGGSLAAQTWSVICVALTMEGYLTSSVAAGVLPASSGIIATAATGVITRTNADSSTDTYGGGCAQQSSAVTGTTSGSSGSLACSVTWTTGAVAYAWFWGSASAEKLGAITTINSISVTAAATGTQLASAIATADSSQNALLFDGLLSIIQSTNSGAYVKTLATGTAGTGTPLTADTFGGIVEIDNALKSFWDNYRLSPDIMFLPSDVMQSIGKLVLTNTSSGGAQRFTFDANQGMVVGGVVVKSYLNKFGMNGPQEIAVKLHPNMPPGHILFFSSTVPYPLSNVGAVNQIRTRQEYRQIEWPLRSPKYEYEVMCDEVLQCYFPPSLGMIRNIAPS